MKARLISYAEVEEQFRDVLTELGNEPLNEAIILEKGTAAAFLLGVCIAQLRAPNSRNYAGKDEHLRRLEQANGAITYKLNTCTVKEISAQVRVVCRAFGVH